MPGVADAMVSANRALYEAARDAGGKHYPIGSIPLSPADWALHYGVDHPAFVRDKLTYDPRLVLAPGQGIFG